MKLKSRTKHGKIFILTLDKCGRDFYDAME